jgi:eukaryotic-like serine/threonine-protein kinase
MAPPSTELATKIAPLSPSRASGVYQTSPGLLRRRAIGPSGEGLAQYLALRLGNMERGRAAYRSLMRMVNALPPGELVEAPGPKARMYRIARSIVETERAMPDFRPDRGSLPWRAAEGNRGVAIARLRAELSPRDAELIELRHARELDAIEIACVLEATPDEIELALDTAEARARRILGAHAPDPLAPRASEYVEAFALDPRDESEDIDFLLDEDEPLEKGAIIGGRYRILERVGVGAFGDVYRADDTEVPGHRVALKLLRQPSLSESARQSALRELRINAAVFHPSLVQFKDHGWYEQRLWFVMPWYDGETLEQRMKRDPLDRAEARRIFEALARALAALHEAGIRHQDIKPDNILLARLPGQDDLPVLIDLGVAADEQEGLLGGTPLYFAPEVAARFAGGIDSEHEVGFAADVFALALALRNALEPDTQEDVPAGAIGAFIRNRAENAPPLPRGRDLRFLRSSFERWMSCDPNDRPSASELAQELTVLTAPEERRERRRRIARWLAPLLLSLAAIFGLVVHQLEQRAAVQARDARAARTDAQEARADLVLADARRRSLEEDRAALQQRYAESRMSRRELTDRLGSAEARVNSLERELADTSESADALRDRWTETRQSLSERETELAAIGRTLAARESELEAVRGERDQAIDRGARVDRDLEAARADLRTKEQELADLRTRSRDLASEVAAERSARRAAEDRAVGADAQVASAQEALAEAAREVARLRSELETRDAARASEPIAPTE